MSDFEITALLARLHTKITPMLKKRLRWACQQRTQLTARRCTEGEILSELYIHLEPHPSELQPLRRQPRPQSIKKRGKADAA
jgi:hypothetical protein